MAWPTVVVDTADMDATTDNPGNARAAIKQMADNVNAIKDSKGAASGIAPLDGSSKVPTANLPTIPANQGGTGHTAFTVGDIFYANTTATLAKLAAGTNGQVLTSNGAGAAPSYQNAGGGLTTGTRMSFNQTAAPVGWTKDTTAALNDSILRIVTGTVGSGGSTAFSTFNAQTSVGATTLTTSQLPQIDIEAYINTGSFGTGSLSGNPIGNIALTADVGAGNWASSPQWRTLNRAISLLGGARIQSLGGGSHTHTMTTAIKYNDFIIAQKD